MQKKETAPIYSYHMSKFFVAIAFELQQGLLSVFNNCQTYLVYLILKALAREIGNMKLEFVKKFIIKSQ
jgi:hypothetical protein